MIRDLRHKDIDREKWDRCINESNAPRIYALGWYLDRTSPGWDAMILGDYEMVLPLPKSRHRGFQAVMRPLFSQQTGPFTSGEKALKQLEDMIRKIPAPYRMVELSLVSGTGKYLKNLPYRMRKNYVLDLDSKGSFRDSMNENTRRNIRKSRNNDLLLDRNLDVETLVSFKHKNEIVSLKRKHYAILRDLLASVHERKAGMAWGVRNRQGALLSVVYLLKYMKRYYYLVSASNKEGKEKRAMFYLLDSFLEQDHAEGSVLDFEGSDVPGVARFFQGFGARPEPYPHLRINRLPWPLK